MYYNNINFFTISTTSIIKLTCSLYALKSYTISNSLSQSSNQPSPYIHSPRES